MSKVLIDRELLERILRHDFAEDCQECAIGKSEAWSELRAVVKAVQPAEAEGVEVVAYAYIDETPEDYLRTKPFVLFARPDGSAPGPGVAHQRLEPLVRLAALSAVTAERDRLREEISQVRGANKILRTASDMVRDERDQLRAEVEGLRKAAEPLEPVNGDQLPPIGSKVLIHLSRSDAWVEHTVAGYYAWGDLKGDEYLHRVFVRVRDSDGYLNARLLKDVRPVGAAMAAKEA